MIRRGHEEAPAIELGDAAVEDAFRRRAGRAPCNELPPVPARTGADERPVCIQDHGGPRLEAHRLEAAVRSRPLAPSS